MKRSQLVWVIVFAVALCIIIFILYTSLDKKKFNWSETYNENSNEPFSTSVLSELLKNYFDGYNFSIVQKDFESALTKTDSTHATYFFTGSEAYYTDTNFALLKSFIQKGNDAFIATINLPEKIKQEIFNVTDAENYSAEYDTTFASDSSYIVKTDSVYNYNTGDSLLAYTSWQYAKLNFTDPAFKKEDNYIYTFQVKDQQRVYNWKYFDSTALQKCTEPVKKLGTIYNSNYNFIQIKIGEGNLYLYTTPIILTNFYLIQKQNLEYTSKLLSYLKPGNIIWDEYSKLYRNENNLNTPEQAGPFRYILSQPALRWAWYTLLAGILFFMFFSSKRLQQTIPVTEPNINKSLEFVQTIGRMYYIRKNHKQLVQQKFKLFLYYIKDRYQLSTIQHDEDFLRKLSLKSQIEYSRLSEIFSFYKFLDAKPGITAEELHQFHFLTEYFYKNCK